MEVTINAATPIAIPPAKKETFNALTRAPEFAWITVGMGFTVIFMVLAVDALALGDHLSMPLAAVLNGVLLCFTFSIIHDAIHRALCRDVALNDKLGFVATVIFSPYASLKLFRWAHMEHHRFTNAPEDPDNWTHGSVWSLPFRWMTIDIFYLVRALQSDQPQVKKILWEMVPQLTVAVVLATACVLAGYGTALVFLVLVPTRITLVLNGFMFFWLPHAHHKPFQSENLTLATTVRLGSEWLLTPLLQCQNYHLIHHLWPTTPFYNNVKVWRLLEPELRQRDLAIQRNFAIMPEFVSVNPLDSSPVRKFS